MNGSFTYTLMTQLRQARFEEDRLKQAGAEERRDRALRQGQASRNEEAQEAADREREAKQDDRDGEQLAALSEEAAELKRARIMNRCEPGYERKDGKL